MEQKELMEEVQKLLSDNPAKFIKIRDAFDDVFEERTPNSAKAITDREFERLRYKFRDIDVPLSWCISKESVYQLQKAVSSHRSSSRNDDSRPTGKKPVKPRKKGILSIFR